MLGTLLGLALAVCGAGPAGAMVTLSAVSEDPYTNTDSQHRTQVEPDTFASGNTIVAAFQSGRFTDGGASNVGWATSTDAGATWTRLDASQYMVWRPFYFSNLIVDPKNENKVFKVDLVLLLSVNGGESFSAVSNQAHGDFHDVWINPDDPNTIFATDDGGLWRSFRSWCAAYSPISAPPASKLKWSAEDRRLRCFIHTKSTG